MSGGLFAASVAFYLVFGVFVVAFTGLAVFTIVWAVRRDMKSRREWLASQRSGQEPNEGI